MDKIFENYVESLIQECLKGAKFAYLPQRQKKEIEGKIRDHFYSVTINTLIDQLSDEQLLEIKDLEPGNPILVQKFERFAAEIPGFASVLEDKLKAEMDQILQTGQIPQ